jgi:hypothetical protein
MRAFLLEQGKLPNTIHFTLHDELDFYDLSAEDVGGDLLGFFVSSSVRAQLKTFLGMRTHWDASETKLECTEAPTGPIFGGLLNDRQG